MKQLDKRYYKALNEAKERADYTASLQISTELLYKSFELLKKWGY